MPHWWAPIRVRSHDDQECRPCDHIIEQQWSCDLNVKKRGSWWDLPWTWKREGVHDYGGEVEATFCSATSCSCAEEMPSCPSVTSPLWPPQSCYLGGPALVSSTSADLVYPSDSCYPERLLGMKCSGQVEGHCTEVCHFSSVLRSVQWKL